MLTKIIFLLFASVALAFHLKTTVEELQRIYEDVSATILVEEHEAQISIRSFEIPLKYYTEQTATYIIGNLTEAAQPYWNQLALIQAQAEADGKNISVCVELGNNQLYVLNNTVVSPLIRQVNSYLTEGNKLLVDNSGAAYNTIEELLSFEARVNECSNNTCAGELQTGLINYYQNAMETLAASVSDSNKYVLVDLRPKLDKLTIDSDAYAKSYAPFIEDVQTCSNNQ